MDAIESVAEPIETEVVEQEPVEATESAATPQDVETQEPVVEEPDGDGRALPKEVQSALKALRESNPKAADALRKSYFSHQQYTQTFKTPAEAREAKTALDLIGGHEGITGLQSQVAAIEAVDGALEAGDPQVLDDIAADFPEGFKKLAGPYLEKLEKLDPKAFESVTQPIAYRAMESAGLGDVLVGIHQALESNNPNAAKELVTKTWRWLEAQKQAAGERKQNTDDPRAKALEEREAKLNQKEESTFRNEVGRETTGYQSTLVETQLKPYLKLRNLSTEARADLAGGIHQEISRLLKADASYQSQVKALLAQKNRDPQKISSYVKAKLDQVTPGAVKTVWQRRYGSVMPTKPAQNATNPNPAPQAGPILISAKPSMEQVQKVKGYLEMYIAGKAIMAAGPHKGKMVTWKR